MAKYINNNANNIEYWKKEYLELSKENEELSKYKNAWKDMRKWFSQRNSKYDTPKSLEIENFVSTFMQELEQKYNLGE